MTLKNSTQSLHFNFFPLSHQHQVYRLEIKLHTLTGLGCCFHHICYHIPMATLLEIPSDISNFPLLYLIPKIKKGGGEEKRKKMHFCLYEKYKFGLKKYL